MQDNLRVLFIGDIVGRPGRNAVKSLLPGLIEKLRIDFIIANGENAAGGFGITEKVAKELFEQKINVITTGNHVWDKKEDISFIAKEPFILRPFNYPAGVPGHGSIIYTLNGFKIGVVNLQGRVFMTPVDCPFRTGLIEIERILAETRIIIIDFHAEATSEKMALGYYLDGMVSAVIGTHTHVQTADERILPKGTAYITDVGMTGPVDSIIGIEIPQIIDRFLYQMPKKFEVAKGRSVLSAVLIDIDTKTGLARSIQRLNLTGG
ncbi:MAG: TIGR00282 family metallophosphoesterase [Thermodesulfovibrionales bacterium]|nr:TIGR00282 family metallophosphoesterase [Thermodesulfovibrionales bacterium]